MFLQSFFGNVSRETFSSGERNANSEDRGKDFRKLTQVEFTLRSGRRGLPRAADFGPQGRIAVGEDARSSLLEAKCGARKWLVVSEVASAASPPRVRLLEWQRAHTPPIVSPQPARPLRPSAAPLPHPE